MARSQCLLPANHRWVTKWLLWLPAFRVDDLILSHLFWIQLLFHFLRPSVMLSLCWLPRMSSLFGCFSYAPCLVVAPPSPSVGPLWRLGPGCSWSLPLGICCLWRRPSCLASMLGVSWRIVSPLHCVSWQQRPVALCGDSSLYTMLHVLLGCCVLSIHLRMILAPFWDSVKAHPYPLWCACVHFSLCPLLPPGSSLLFFLGAPVCGVCVTCPAPLPLLPPHDGRVLRWLCCRVFVFFVDIYRGCCMFNGSAVFTEVTNALPPVTKDLLSTFWLAADFVDELIWIRLVLSVGFSVASLIGQGLFPFGLFSVFVPRGAVATRLEPWTGLHCCEPHWRWPVELPAVQSGAPVSSKVCQHGSSCADVMWWLCRWPTRWESGPWFGIHC